MSRMYKKHKRQLFVQVRSNWAGDTWKLVDGPFDTYEEAEEAARKYEYHPIAPWSGAVDIAQEVHARVVNKTEAGLTPQKWPEAAYWMMLLHDDPSKPWNRWRL